MTDPVSHEPLKLRTGRIEICLFAAVFVLYGFFYNGASWNQNSRLDVIFSFVEPGTADSFTFHIDRFVYNAESARDDGYWKNTGDWSNNPEHDDHFYSNKAPGVAMLGIPFYTALFYGERMIGVDADSHTASLTNAYLINLFVSVLPAAISVIFFFRLLLALTSGNIRRSLVLTLVLYFCTLCFPFSTSLWGHMTATAFVVCALYCFQRDRLRSYLWCGFLMGVAVLCEYSCALILLSLMVSLLWMGRWRELLKVVAGGLLPLVVFLGYHKICFGSALVVANSYINPQFQQDAERMMSMVYWFQSMHQLTVMPYRGLFFSMPVLLFAIPALWPKRDRAYTLIEILCIVNIVMFLIMNMSFNGWHGGAAFGPRYLIPSLPFYILAMARYTCRARALIAAAALAAVISLSNMLVTSAISPMARQSWANPLRGYYLLVWYLVHPPPQLNGHVPLHLHMPLPIRLQHQTVSYRPLEFPPALGKLSAFNLGEIIGLKRLWSVLPWFWLCGVAGVGIWSSVVAAEKRPRIVPEPP